MNIETREVRDVEDLTPRELASGKWIELKTYVPKTPVSDRDYRRILLAEERRLNRAARRLARLRHAL